MFGHGQGSAPSSLPRQDARPSDRQSLPTTADGLPPLDAEFWAVVDRALSAIQVELTPGARAGLDAQARLLGAWNRAINLTALRTPEQVARRHVVDSLAAVPVLRRLAARARPSALGLLDIGSGGGYPGLPLAVALPVGRCALVDSVAKKARFLDVAAAAASAAMRAAGENPPRFAALPERAEDLADSDHRGRWSFVVARAVGSLAEVVELALPLVAADGYVVAWKLDQGDGALEREVEAAATVTRLCGGTRARVTPLDESGALELPGHVLVTVRKVRPTPARFPRPPAERRRALLT